MIEPRPQVIFDFARHADNQVAHQVHRNERHRREEGDQQHVAAQDAAAILPDDFIEDAVHVDRRFHERVILRDHEGESDEQFGGVAPEIGEQRFEFVHEVSSD